MKLPPGVPKMWLTSPLPGSVHWTQPSVALFAQSVALIGCSANIGFPYEPAGSTWFTG